MHPAGYADMAYAFNASKTVFLFHVSRTGMDFLQYRFLEDLKDRLVFSTKYQSTMKGLYSIPYLRMSVQMKLNCQVIDIIQKCYKII